MTESKTAKPRFIKPPNALKEKVGSGGIPAHLIEKAQIHINDNPVDYRPEGLESLKKIQTLLEEIESATVDRQIELLHILVEEVMQLKASGGMFQFQLVSMIADVLLDFLETVNTVNEDVLKIIHAHNTIVTMILSKGLKGDGGKTGSSLSRELFKACVRYYDKYETA